MQKLKRTFRSHLIVGLLLVTLSASTLPAPACNSKKTLEVAAEAAKDIGGGTRDVIQAVGQAYDKKLITLEQKDKLADLLGQIARGGQKGVAALQALEAAGVTELSSDHRANLNKLFDDAVIGPFLDLLTEIGKLSSESSMAIRAALATVRTAILLFSQKIGRLDVEKMITTREAEYA